MRKTTKTIVGIFSILAISFSIISCSFEEQIDPNAPSLESVLENASEQQLNNIAVGTESAMRSGLGIRTTASGTMARELYLFNADPRNTEVLLGKNGSTLSNGDFYATGPWSGSYKAIKNANILIVATENATKAVSSEEKNGYLGFAKTVIGYELIEVLKMYGKARVDVADENNLGPLLEFDEAMTSIRTLIDEAKANLDAAGDEFAFVLAGFTGFNTPSSFAKFNRAVAALAAVYAGDKSAAKTHLSNSYFDINGDLLMGPMHVFSQNSGDITNPIFKGASTIENPNNSDQIIVHNSWINDAETGDIRVVSKSAPRPDPSAQDDLNGTHETSLYATNTSPIRILRNEELILLYAEANIGIDANEALVALNKIRTSFNLPEYSGATDNASLVTELLKQRRYSLWCENHRMFDLRRYNLSSSLPIDRIGDVVYNIMPIPFSENIE